MTDREVPWVSPAWTVAMVQYINTNHRSNSPFGTWQLVETQQLQDKKRAFGSYYLKSQIAEAMFGLRRIQKSQNVKQISQGQQP